LPALALLAAAGVDWVAEAVSARWSRLSSKRMWAALSALVCGALVMANVRVHPYYIDYYGEQVGGAEQAAKGRWFEIAWWGEGVGEAIDYINRHAKPGERFYRGCVEPAHLGWFRGDL